MLTINSLAAAADVIFFGQSLGTSSILFWTLLSFVFSEGLFAKAFFELSFATTIYIVIILGAIQ